MYYFYIFTILALLISFFFNRRKTLKSLQIAVRRLLKISPALFLMIIYMSVALFFIPDNVIIKYLGAESKFTGFFLAMAIGSITIMPGFIAFPLASILLKKGVTYMAVSAFTTTLMMVGVLTYPLEREYLGTKVTIIRNIISLLIAFIVSLVIGFFYGEFLF